MHEILWEFFNFFYCGSGDSGDLSLYASIFAGGFKMLFRVNAFLQFARAATALPSARSSRPLEKSLFFHKLPHRLIENKNSSLTFGSRVIPSDLPNQHASLFPREENKRSDSA